MQENKEFFVSTLHINYLFYLLTYLLTYLLFSTSDSWSYINLID